MVEIKRRVLMKHFVVLSVLVTAALACGAQSTTSYATIYNEFAQLNHNSHGIIDGNNLCLENNSTRDIIVLDTTRIDPFSSYKYYIHFANLHNEEGKSYKAIDNNGKTKAYNATSCGIVFNYSLSSYWMLTAHGNNTNLFNESVDERTMTLVLSKVTNNSNAQIIETKTLSSNVDLTTGFNYMGVKVENGTITVLAGDKALNEVFTHKIDQIIEPGTEAVKVGYVVGPAAAIAIERAVLTVCAPTQDPGANLSTPWTREALDRHFSVSKNPFEGYWTYLDRDMEDTWLKLGGRYTIALVETTSGYDIIYIDGAQVKKSQWHPGMKKGEMKSTIFTDNFTGTWVDATLEPITQDVYATFESGVILTIKFPVYKSQIRFSKILDNQQ